MTKFILATAALSAALTLAPQVSRAQSDLPLSTGNGAGQAIEGMYRGLQTEQARMRDGRNAAAMAEGRRNIDVYQGMRALGNIERLPR